MSEQIIGYDCCNQEIIPIENRRLIIKTNAHQNTDGSLWGWVEGCTKNICWSNSNTRFNESTARKLIYEWNKKIQEAEE